MTEKELLKLGYFPKELPPPFESKTFSNKINVIKTQWNSISSPFDRTERFKYSDSKWVLFSIPKVQLSRRIINIPNPLHQSKLTSTIANRWTEINDIFKKSTISSSSPIKDDKGNRALISKHNFSEFKRRRSNESFANLYEVKTDVSRFYGTIYTHSIPWLVHTKPIAKAHRTDMTMLGNALDKDLRNLNSGQTVGIPIGPDTSLVIAEIMSCLIDIQIQTKLKNVQSFRFIDDYYVYCDNYADAEKAFKFIQSLLTEYQLDINEEKTKISKAPFAFDSKWSIDLGSFTFRKRANSQLTDIERFVSLSIIHSNENPKDSVLLFSIQVLKYLQLFDENWSTYESLILKIGITEPRTLPVVTEILASNISRISKKKVKSIIEKLIDIHLPKGHNYEVSWALWMCVEFNIKLKNKMAERIFASNDYVSMLIAMDLKSKGLINSTVSTDGLLTELTEESLMNENWLFTYESIKKGWLVPTDNPIDENKYFKILLDNGIYFYKEDAKVKTFTVKKAEAKVDEITKKPEKEEATSIVSGGGIGAGGY
ncbi:RNA-directed DNA polymerase [Tenacibaculum finnmarkense]|uniref:RNA-directed DNA polymerase n=1 Tax=Tenacibaculum TaxID=104267 RepID=UPI001E6296EC|nr:MULTISPECIES: RNA-directed DNA polymerase [Tenacibaculum]MCD8401423.1 RNA-directed DNA polymerase [Tenacibaculum finnmarkense genomovar ulcerans]MCG8786469.1 RNA-directed DNA polymerase [Tenacibaculum finnmarkense]MCG8813993.1 RNA-directed DNA polymerase [Tenacibaculum finnmarkense]